MAQLTSVLQAETDFTSSNIGGTDTFGPFSTDQFNQLAIDVAVEVLTATKQIQFFVDRVGDTGTGFQLLAATAITAAGKASYSVGAGVAEVAGVSTSQSLGRRIQVRAVNNDTSAPKFRISVIAKG